MDTEDDLVLGLGVKAPWKLVGQRLDTDKRPKELQQEVAAERGVRSGRLRILLDWPIILNRATTPNS